MDQTHFGAHELLECHEVLSDAINGINQFQLYLSHCQDIQLKNIIQNQISFMTNEYNSIVQALHHKANMQSLPTVHTRHRFDPTYGLAANLSFQPNYPMNQMNDRDVASSMLRYSKSSALVRMHAALECSDAPLRDIIAQGAKNCADQAYETWSYLNEKGYYRVPMFDQETVQTLLNSYQQTSDSNSNRLNDL
ncbi:spore coat protein [Bacillus sp. Marseille-P3661]|uniref:spore coat protein n=1 Tax=Bacillus sp. Marseille-P3661 TaxID=1936234 RepID=UPI000C81A97E|nr:spore coat protein [Bacillus sp. Marseille-P3661]